jgi:hypothetical protein
MPNQLDTSRIYDTATDRDIDLSPEANDACWLELKRANAALLLQDLSDSLGRLVASISLRRQSQPLREAPEAARKYAIHEALADSPYLGPKI